RFSTCSISTKSTGTRCSITRRRLRAWRGCRDKFEHRRKKCKVREYDCEKLSQCFLGNSGPVLTPRLWNGLPAVALARGARHRTGRTPAARSECSHFRRQRGHGQGGGRRTCPDPFGASAAYAAAVAEHRCKDRGGRG